MLLCIAGAALNAALFCGSFFRSLAKLNEEPVAVVAFKYKTARRKFLGRAVWDRLRQDSPVYNGDTIHTAQASGATIWFSDGNIMELSERTMAQVFLDGDKTLRARLSEGSALIDASASARGMSVSSQDVEVSVRPGASVNAMSAASGGVFSMQVFKGGADVSASDGPTVPVGAGEAVRVDGGAAVKIPLSAVAPPPNARIVCHTEGAAAVRFAWSAEPSDFSTGIVFELACDRAFEDVVSRRTVARFSELTEECAPGTYFWRLYAVRGAQADFDSAAGGTYTVVRSLPPRLAAPSRDSAISYRSRLPAVRFVWSESAFASSYRLVVADNPALDAPAVDCRQDSASAIISTLGEGTWFWQVTPYYAFNGIGFEASSEVGQFQIARKEALSTPVLLVPQDGAVVNAGGGKGVLFSWKMDAEADSYRLLVADNPQLARPLVDVRTSENCYALDAGKLERFDGTYWWGVSYTDSEGAASGWSAVNALLAVKAAPEHRAVEPSDGYRVAQNLVPDMVFSWKSSLPDGFEDRLQIASDKSFSQLVYDCAAAGSSMKGVNLDAGDYWWRLKSSCRGAGGAADGMERATEARLLRVLDALDKAVLVQPLGRVVAQTPAPVAFRWEAVDGADFYQFAVFGADGVVPVCEETVFGTEASADLSGVQPEGALYRWEVQARADSVPGVQSRISGRCAEAEFQLVKARPVAVTAPARNAAVDGIDAVLRPVVARWTADEPVQSAVLTLRRTDVSPPQVVLQVPSAAQIAAGRGVAPDAVVLDTAGGLRPGTYEIIVRAVTADGIDISNTDEEDVGRFTVLPAAPLDAPAGFSATPGTLDAAWLQNPENHRGIRFSWMPVDGATDYLFSVARADGGRAVLRRRSGGSCGLSLDFSELSEADRLLFMNGRFIATVEAERRIDRDGDGSAETVLQGGRKASASFATAVPSPKKADGGNAANLYGK